MSLTIQAHEIGWRFFIDETRKRADTLSEASLVSLIRLCLFKQASLFDSVQIICLSYFTLSVFL